MGRGILLYFFIIFGAVGANAAGETPSPTIECIKAATSGPNGEFTRDQIRLILQSIAHYWTQEFATRGMRFEPIRYRVFERATQTACGPATRDFGPFYCHADHTVYVDPVWFRTVRGHLGDETQTLLTFALAHEVGHHIQQQLDVIIRTERTLQMKFGVDYITYIDLGPPFEYQADCLAAVYLSTLHELHILSDEDVSESVARMLKLGDDAAKSHHHLEKRLESMSRMRLSIREGYSHGTSENRQKWFVKGFDGHKLEVCEPFLFPTLK